MAETPQVGELDKIVEEALLAFDAASTQAEDKFIIRAAILSYAQEDKREYARQWRNDAIEAAAKIVKRYQGNPYCIKDILALKD